jgi:pyrimidine-specific ribonucleoside hydrolase
MVGVTAWANVATSVRASTAHPASVPHVVIDTDLSKWWDDVTALGIANVLDSRGELKLLGTMSDVTNPIAVAAIDAIDTAYHHPDLPIGAVTGSENGTFDHGYTDTLVAKLPHSVDDSRDVPDAVALYRRLLEHAPDHSVTIVSLGGYTNLAGLLAAADGPHLITHKVKRLVIMDGFFPNGIPPATNQKIDPAAATAVVTGWPGPIAWADGTVGIGTKVGAGLCTSVAADHPMRVAYEALFGCGPPTDGDWDAPALLYAVGDQPHTFTELGQGGSAVINDQGGLSWKEPSTRAHDVYVHVSNQTALNQRIDDLLSAG